MPGQRADCTRGGSSALRHQFEQRQVERHRLKLCAITVHLRLLVFVAWQFRGRRAG
jgi:hypothetical protein